MADRAGLTLKHRGGIYTTGEGMELHVPPSGFDWRAVVGGAPGVIDPFAETSAQEFPLGTKLVYGVREFRYTLNGGTALEVSALCQAVVPLAGHINEAMSTVAVDATTLTFTPNTATTDDLTAQELQDGFIFVYDDGGEGHLYQIGSHAAVVGGNAVTLTLVDPVRVAIVAAATGTVLHNPYSAVIIHPSPPTAKPVGWTQNAVTADYYFWLLVTGPTAALIDGTVIMGKMCRPSEDDDGAVADLAFNEGTGTAPDTGAVGWVMEIGADAAGAAATYGAVWATLG